jgi:hypothetical protein
MSEDDSSSSTLVLHWLPWLERHEKGPPKLDHSDDLVAWGVLGISRLHYTLATGRITSKAGAGQHALMTFDARWHPILREAIRIRSAPGSGSHYASASQRRLDVGALMALVIESGRRPRHQMRSNVG